MSSHKKRRFTLPRLVQIALSFYDEVRLGELVDEVSYLTERYYHRYYPPDETFRDNICHALSRLRGWGKAKRVKRGVWCITEYGLIDLAKYHLNVRRLPDELMSRAVKYYVEWLIRKDEAPPFRFF